MMDFGWKRKTDHLAMVILSGAHQLAKDLPPGILATLAFFARVAKSGDGTGAVEELARLQHEHMDEPKPLWEPAEIYGWKIQATLYLQNGQLWWLTHAERRNGQTPRDKDIDCLDKILDRLGADPKRDMIIGPRSSPPGEEALPFGWWAWFNRKPLFDIQVHKAKHGKEAVRIVPHGSRESDGYQILDQTLDVDEEEVSK